MLKLLTLIILLAVIGLAVWYADSYYRYLPELRKNIEVSENELNGDSSVLQRLAIAAETGEGIAQYAASSAYYQLSRSSLEEGSKLKWHLNEMLWYMASRLHFSDQEVFYLWCRFAFNVDGLGINNAALKYFGKPVLSLSFRQQAQIVSLIKGPSVFVPNSERGNQRLEWVLNRYNEI